MNEEKHLVAQISHRAIIVKDRKVLLDLDRKGDWEFPGGRIHIGEEPVESLKREIKEELFVSIEVGQVFETYVYYSPRGNRYTVIYLAHTPSPINLEVYQQDDIFGLRWVSSDEVMSLPMMEENRKVLIKFFDSLR